MTDYVKVGNVFIVAGQIWKEVDPRFERYVIIQHVGEGRRSIQVRTVTHNGKGWEVAPKSKSSWCDAERFNGKRGGYQLWQEAE